MTTYNSKKTLNRNESYPGFATLRLLPWLSTNSDNLPWENERETVISETDSSKTSGVFVQGFWGNE